MKKLIMAVIETGQDKFLPDVVLPLIGEKAVNKEDAQEVLADFLESVFNDLEGDEDDDNSD